MRLLDIIGSITDYNDDHVVVAVEPSRADSEAMVVAANEAGEPETPPGMAYLLEVSLIKEVMAVWSDWRSGRQPTPTEAWRATLYYATHDAYIPVSADPDVRRVVVAGDSLDARRAGSRVAYLWDGTVVSIPDALGTDDQIRAHFNADEVVHATPRQWAPAKCVDGPREGHETYAAREADAEVVFGDGARYVTTGDLSATMLELRYVGDRAPGEPL